MGKDLNGNGSKQGPKLVQHRAQVVHGNDMRRIAGNEEEVAKTHIMEDLAFQGRLLPAVSVRRATGLRTLKPQ